MKSVTISLSILLLVVYAASFVQVTVGAVYKVGDSNGWEALGYPFYKDWADSKIFHVNDTLLFEYDPQYHNVMQVTYADYKSCNTTSPVTKYTSGNDSIAITSPGHYFFICGVPGGCPIGQKVPIIVPLAVAPINAPSV